MCIPNEFKQSNVHANNNPDNIYYDNTKIVWAEDMESSTQKSGEISLMPSDCFDDLTSDNNFDT